MSNKTPCKSCGSPFSGHISFPTWSEIVCLPCFEMFTKALARRPSFTTGLPKTLAELD